jgi:hypothetical protein
MTLRTTNPESSAHNPLNAIFTSVIADFAA